MFESLELKLDKTSASGKLLFRIFGASTELERELNREWTNAGTKIVIALGINGGRLKFLSKEDE